VIESFQDMCHNINCTWLLKIKTYFIADIPATAASGGYDRSERLKFHRSVLGDGIVGGQVWIASYGNEPFAGAAIWYPPGASLFAT
jgi:hypothetical protein